MTEERMADSRLVTVRCVRCGKNMDVAWYIADCSITCTCAQEDMLFEPASFCEEFNTLMTKLEQRV